MDEDTVPDLVYQETSRYLEPLPLWKRIANVFRRMRHLPVYTRRMVIVMKLKPVYLLPAPKEEA
jgi:hypothetical protein